jgi:hypothetical protein
VSGDWARVALAAALALACARMAPPPGGPEDLEDPRVIATRPDTVAIIPDFRGAVEFLFNEVISEGSAPNFGLGTGSLEQLVLLSPSNEVPEVRWRRSRITVRPRGGWQEGIVYRVELLPGVSDLRTNRTTTSTVVTFTTGADLPITTLRGRIVDWTSRRPQPGGIVQAVLQVEAADSLVYRSVADSLGFFEFGPLPAGEYLVFGGIDQNRNLRIEPRELFDSIRVAIGQDSVGEIWAFRHDSVGPRLQTVARRDSISINLTFNQMLAPRATYDSTAIRVLLLPDSVPVPVVGVFAPALYDSLFARRPELLTAEDSARADSLRLVQERRDSLRADSLARAERLAAERAAEDARRGIVRRSDQAPPTRQLDPLTTRPALSDRLIVRLDTLLIPEGRYVVEATGLANLSGIDTTSFLVLIVPAPPPPDTTTRPDTTAARPDTTGVVPDSIRPPPDTLRQRLGVLWRRR